jgi:hypothetical protein
MKKILNEWRTFLSETDPKHPPKLNPSNPYDRSKTVHVQSATKGGLELIRTLITQYLTMMASYDVGHEKNFEGVIHYIEQLGEPLRNKVSEDIKILKFIYSRSNRTDYQPKAGRITVFNDTRAVSPDTKIDNIMTHLGIQPLTGEPDTSRIEEVFKFYVMPKNFDSIYGEPEELPPPTTSSRFSNMPSADELARRNYELWLKNKRNK